MTTPQSHEWKIAVLGETAVYPGHPIVVATMIMDRYEDLDHANAKAIGSNYKNALSDSFVWGAGCAVHAALDLLKCALRQEGEAARDTALKMSKDYWDSWEGQSANNRSNAEAGRRQAISIFPGFLTRLEAWKNGRPTPSPYRLCKAPQEIEC